MFIDRDVKAVMNTIGGLNSNQLLPLLDFDLIADNPKILVGYSDITTVLHAVTSTTGLVTLVAQVLYRRHRPPKPSWT